MSEALKNGLAKGRFGDVLSNNNVIFKDTIDENGNGRLEITGKTNENTSSINFKKEKIVLYLPNDEHISKMTKYVIRKTQDMQDYATQKTKEVKDLFLSVAKVCDELDEIDVYNNLNKANYDKLVKIMDDIEKIKQYFDTNEFSEIFIDATQAMIVHQEMELAKIQVRDVKTDDEKRKKMVDWVYAHKYWLFTLAGLMDAVLTAIIRRGKDSHFSHKLYDIDSYYIAGRFRDLDKKDKDDEYTLEIEIDSKKVAEVKTINNGFRYLIPSYYFNNFPHTIMVKEKSNDMVLLNSPQSEILLDEDKENVLKIENSGYDFSVLRYDFFVKNSIMEGYFKNYNNEDEEFEIEIEIDNEIIKTLKTSKTTFEYPIPNIYCDDKQHIINAKEVKTGIRLSKKDIEQTLSEDEKNMASFIASLYQPFDESLKDVYGKNAIGFLAIKENLEDKEFMAYIEELSKRFPDVKMYGFVFGDMNNRTYEFVEYIKIKSLKEILEKITIYLWSTNTTYDHIVTRKIISLDDKNLEAKYNLGIMAVVQGREEEAKKIWESLAKKYPNENVGKLAADALVQLEQQ